MPIGLFFENRVHYNAIYPRLCYHISKNREGIIELAEALYDKSIASFWDGVGRSGKSALRGRRNFADGLQRQAYFAGSGLDPKPKKGDVYIPVSRSGRKELADRAKKAKKHGMKIAAITGDSENQLAKEADIVINMPVSIPGESDLKQYFEDLVTNPSEKETPQQKIPFQELGAVFEFTAWELIDALSFSFTRYRVKERFPFRMILEKIYNSVKYIGEVGYALEEQKLKIDNMITTILESPYDVCITGFGVSGESSTIAAIRTGHEIYERGKREAKVIDSTNFPKIKKGEILIPISGRGTSWFTNYVAKIFADLGNQIFPLTYEPDSELVELAGIDNTIVFPKGELYEFNERYVIRDFDVGAIMVLDSIILSLGRRESEMEHSHSIFS